MSKFSVICMDPPYSFNDKLRQSSTKRGAEDNYSVMSNEELLSLPIKDIADPNGAVLALWVPSSLLELGIQIMNAWNFQLKQTFIWGKSKKEPFKKNKAPNLNDTLGFGMGRIFRQSHEIALIGINNTKIYKKLQNRSQRSMSFDINEKHSKKPETLQDRLEIMFPTIISEGKAIELFARRQRNNWICLGNEIGDKKDIRDSIQELIEKDKDENIAA